MYRSIQGRETKSKMKFRDRQMCITHNCLNICSQIIWCKREDIWVTAWIQIACIPVSLFGY